MHGIEGLSEERPGILFLCVANSARSQMAEGLAREMAPAGVEIHSAGSEPAVINPFAVQALAAIDIDATAQHSKGIPDVPADRIGLAITLCAEEVCPVFPHPVHKLHWPHEDPAAATGDDAARLASFETVRDQLAARLRALFEGDASAR